ncbi:MAG TPA: DUF1800 domain-containing protein [Candidatus Binatia bacterium]|nr:DUF1800 domain-containing protein [Candidatus Binatia bacterium]
MQQTTEGAQRLRTPRTILKLFVSPAILSLAMTTGAAGAAIAGSVAVSPTAVTVPTGNTRAFVATVTGLSSTAVTWEVNGKAGGSPQTGTISTAGVYASPASIVTAPTIVTVTARAVASPTTIASAVVTVRHPVPWLTSASPSVLMAGSSFSIDVVGSRFVEGARVVVGGAALPTTYLNSTLLRATGSLAASQIGSLALRVENPGPVASVDYALLGVPPGSSGATDPATLSAVRFLEQASFGPTTSEVQSVVAIGIDAWLARQMDPALTPPSLMPDGLSTGQVSSELMKHMAGGTDQLRQRMVFALSQIFVVSMFKNTNGIELSPWVRMLSKNAFGNFRTLLQDVTISPTMGKYLDMVNSRKPAINNQTSANENYAREVLQLFTIGLYRLERNGLAALDGDGKTIATYDQDVIRNLALAFTGWIYPTAPGAQQRLNNPEYFLGPMEPWDASHDKTQKTLFDGIVVPAGLSAPAEMKIALDRIFEHPNVPPFFATRLIRSLVTSNPSPEYVERVADVFVDNGHGVRGDLAAVLIATLTDEEARDDDPPGEQGHLKDPVLHVLSLMRALGGQAVDPGQIGYLFRNLGEQVLAPTSVFSFYSPLSPVPGRSDLYGPEFQIYSPALAIQRANLIYPLLTGQLASAFSVDLSPYVAAAVDPVHLTNVIDAKLFHGRMSTALRQAILTDAYTQSDKKQRAVGAVYIAAISSEYAVLR